jgi:hypothetical protein
MAAKDRLEKIEQVATENNGHPTDDRPFGVLMLQPSVTFDFKPPTSDRSKETLRDDQNVAWAHLYVGGYIASAQQVLQPH